MPVRLLMAIPSPSPSGLPLDAGTAATGRMLAWGAIAFLFVLVIASLIRKGKDGVD